MILNELATHIRLLSEEQVVQQFSDLLLAWKDDDSTAEELCKQIEQHISRSLIDKTEDHNLVYSAWSEFRDDAILRIGGMTMNERLFVFSLFDRYDACDNDAQVLAVYTKLHASRN